MDSATVLLLLFSFFAKLLTASAYNAAEGKLMRRAEGVSFGESDRSLQPEPPLNDNPPINRPFAQSYSGMILGESALFYLRFQDDAADSSDNALTTMIIGAGKYVNCSGNEAGHFGRDMFRVNVRSDVSINLHVDGYQQRTIEMWFLVKAGTTQYWGDPWVSNLTLYEEGGNDTGIHIFVGPCVNDSKATLYMFMWNHIQKWGSELYGTADVDPEPISCEFAKDEPHYLAFVFDGKSVSDNGTHTPHYSAYLGWPGGSEGVKLCGSKPMGASALKNNTWRGNIKLPWHEGPVGVGGINGDGSRFSATNTCSTNCDVHNFNGIIDEFAIYNTSLTDVQLESHFNTGKEGGVCLPADVWPP